METEQEEAQETNIYFMGVVCLLLSSRAENFIVSISLTFLRCTIEGFIVEIILSAINNHEQ